MKYNIIDEKKTKRKTKSREGIEKLAGKRIGRDGKGLEMRKWIIFHEDGIRVLPKTRIKGEKKIIPNSDMHFSQTT